jgi:hypothetical protein
MRSALPLTLLLAACSLPVKTVIPADELEARRLPNREGVLVGGDLVRLTWLPKLTIQPPAQNDPARFAGLDGPPTPWLVVSRRGEDGRALLTFAGRPDAWRRGILGSRRDIQPALEQARAASTFRTPLKARFGAEEIWAVADLVPAAVLQKAGEELGTVELYASDPRGGQGATTPNAVFVVARRSQGAEEVRRSPGSLPLLSRPDGFWRVAVLERAADGRLTALEFVPWRPAIPAILAGMTAADVVGAGHGRELPMEKLLTDALLEWKTRELAGWASTAPYGELEGAIISAEKGMLQLDLRSRLVKDEIDAAARQGAGPQPLLTEKAQLIDQRKTVIGAVLGGLKAAKAQRVP